MNITDELERLSQLHRDGALDEAEFAQAKARLLNENISGPPSDRSLGEAANRYVTFQIVMGVLGLIVALIIFFNVMLPGMRRAGFPGGNGPVFHVEPGP
jgi:hypothetical protein